MPAALGLALVLAVLGPASALADHVYTGTVLGCQYRLKADNGAQSFSAKISQCGSSVDPEGTLEGSWVSDGSGGTAVSLDSVTISIAGQDQTFNPGYEVTVPVDLDVVANQAQGFQDALQAIESDLVDEAGGFLTAQFGSGVPSVSDAFDDLQAQLTAACAAKDGDPPGNAPVDNDCNPGASPSPDPIAHYDPNDGNVDDGTDADSSDSDQQELCPVFNSIQDDAVFVCVPSFVEGDLDTGNKPLVIVGGGGLMMIPDPTAGGPTTISSKTAIVALGGAILGDNLKLKAPDVALAGGFTDAIGSLNLDGARVSVGEVDGSNLLSGVPGLPDDWHSEITNDIHSTITVPEFVSGNQVNVAAGRSFDLASGSVIDESGRGSHGADFDTGFNPTGESEYYGGSHGGIGGQPVGGLGGQDYGVWYGMQGRSPASDDPFDPTLAGDGGGGEPSGALGLPGGGVVSVDVHGGTANVDGKIDVTGIDTGNPAGNGDHGGGGAGGSVYLAAESLTGSGEIDADGGSNCPDCIGGSGGGGGGGRIAVLSTHSGGWSGRMHAYGGRDEQYDGNPDAEFLGAGGAGTVFTRSVTFDSSGNVASGTGSFPGGTLSVDGGLAPGTYPPPDGTPIADGWSNAKRRLIVTGEARAYAHDLDYKEVDVNDGGTLTAGIGGADASIPDTLSIDASKLDVDSSGRVDMTGRGFAGGSSQTAHGIAGAAPGQTASNFGHGGSHGGVGGATSATDPPQYHSGSTYDDPQAPSLPGGGGGGLPLSAEGNPGGGVLDVDVHSLTLDGVLAADGESSDGPTAIEPAPFDFEGGAGAGGSVYVQADTIRGRGKLTALGGTDCIASSPPLLAGAGGCSGPRGSSGGGGGGRVALIAGSACSWHGKLSAAGGRDAVAEENADHADAKAMRGGDGSTYFPTPSGTCR